jgi:hypothetical protein
MYAYKRCPGHSNPALQLRCRGQILKPAGLSLKTELDLAVIVADLSGDSTLRDFEDTYMKGPELVKQRSRRENPHQETARSRSKKSHGCPSGNPQTVGN